MSRIFLGFFILVILLTAVIFYYQKGISITNKTMPTSTIYSEATPSTSTDSSAKQSQSYEIYNLMGKNSKEVINRLGPPSRIDVSEYDYEWWIYNHQLSEYCQIGIDNDKVVTMYVMGSDVNIAPFHIGQSVDSLKENIQFLNKIEFEVNKNLYQFQLTNQDLETVPLVKVNDIWAQINIDKFSKTVSGIRFLDDSTLVKIRPYELIYRGELISAEKINPEKWDEIEQGKALQILDMTNIIRRRNGLPPVNWDEATAIVAYKHSREMFEQEYFSHNSPTNGNLSDRLLSGGVIFKVAGENIAARYVDAISAVEGWLNSEGHRTTLLNADFTHLGVGVYEKYYTQNFIQAP